jgi:mRNA-decapping enzyme subunit 2
MFQHCPLFSQWSVENYTAAFAEFMAYKSRVPVRGAIMLNNTMDECVLVKGWKKGANWSFPRGKINKDENDLDCAVREVYEETGLDLGAAGLVKDEKDMKFIEINMREQNMKLYVFTAVPKDTHFEPRTRKEISKIEWYKLADLPTIKKHKHQDSNGGDHAATSTNKFYMVAPFLGPLKKWIAQQKKQGNRFSSNLSAPPMLAEESEVETRSAAFMALQQDQIPSDLPEVTISRSAEATAQLKDLFRIGIAQPPQVQPQYFPSAHMPQVDTAKSNALLALLKGGPSVELRAGPHTPLEQASFPPDLPHSTHHSHVRSPPADLAPPPQFHLQSELPTSPGSAMNIAQPLPFRGQAQHVGFPPGPQVLAPPQAPRAPYQQTGDPDFARTRQSSQAPPAVPPASALPKLNSHTKALLDVFTSTAPPVQPSSPRQPIGTKQQSLLDLFKQPTPEPGAARRSTSTAQSSQVSPPSNQGLENTTLPAPVPAVTRPKNTQKSSLLELFGQQGSKASGVPVVEPARPVELSATPDHQQQASHGRKEEALLALLRQQNVEKATHKRQNPAVKEGETAATMSGPLNQPNFEAVIRSHKEDPNGMGRSALTTHRTLFDPNLPAPVKIMARPQTPKETNGKSPRTAKARMATASPKRSTKAAAKEPTKPFQPQILKRPQTAEGQGKPAAADQPPAGHGAPIGLTQTGSATMSREVSSEKEKPAVDRKPARPDSHKQTLLSLFSGASPGVTGGQTPSRVVSPLSTSQLVSPRDEVPVSAIEPISTRSRMGSMASVGGGIAAARPAVEKRQTAAENKAFLLGYLGRMATQEG